MTLPNKYTKTRGIKSFFYKKKGKKYLIKTVVFVGLMALLIFLYSYFSNKEKIKNYLFLDDIIGFLINEEHKHINSITDNMSLYSGDSIPLENMPPYIENAFDDYSLMYKNLSIITTKWENCKYENISKGTTFLKNHLDYIYSIKEHIAKLKPLFNELSIITSTMQSIQTSIINVRLPNNIESDYFGYWTDLADKQTKLGSSIDKIYLDIKELSYSNNFNAIENISYIDFNLKKKHQKQLYDKIELGINNIELKKNEVINKFGTGKRSMTGDLWSGLLLFKNIWINNSSVDSGISKIQESDNFCNLLKAGLSTLTDQDKKGIYEEWMSRENIYRCELFAKVENEKNNIDCSLDFYQDEFGNRIYFNESWGAPYLLSKDESGYYFLNFSQFSKLNNEKTKELIIRFKKEENQEILDKKGLIVVSNNTRNDEIELSDEWLPKIYSKNDTNDCYISYEIKGKSAIGTMFFFSKEKGNIFYKKIVDKGYSVDYILITKSEDVSESIQDLNLFINNTKINLEIPKKTTKTNTKKATTNVTSQDATTTSYGYGTNEQTTKNPKEIDTGPVNNNGCDATYLIGCLGGGDYDNCIKKCQ